MVTIAAHELRPKYGIAASTNRTVPIMSVSNSSLQDDSSCPIARALKGLTLQRFEGRYEGGAKPRPAIGKISIRVVPDSATEIAELLSGRAEWLSQITADQVDQLKTQANLQAFSSAVLRVAFILFDASGRTGANNPMTKLPVRQALSYALDREGLVNNLIQGDERVIDTPCNPVNFGCDASPAVNYPYDPAKAKQLLAQAGYPNGFPITLFTSTARPLEWSEAIQQNWEAVGLKVTVTRMPPQAVNEKLENEGLPAFFTDWGGFRINDASAFNSVYFRGSADDIARDKQVEDWLQEADTSPDAAVRKADYAKAIHRVTEQAYVLPPSACSARSVAGAGSSWRMRASCRGRSPTTSIAWSRRLSVRPSLGWSVCVSG